MTETTAITTSQTFKCGYKRNQTGWCENVLKSSLTLGGRMRKILKFLFSKEIEVAPGVFWLGGTLYENRNKPTTPPPLKWKKRVT